MTDVSPMGVRWPDEWDYPYQSEIELTYTDVDKIKEDDACVMVGGGTITLVGNTLTWSDAFYIYSSRAGTLVTIAANNITIADGHHLWFVPSTRPIPTEARTFVSGTTVPPDGVYCGTRNGNQVILNTNLVDSDKAYGNFFASPAIVAIDNAEGQGDLRYKPSGDFSFCIDLEDTTNDVDGFQVYDTAAEYWKLIRKNDAQIALESVLHGISYEMKDDVIYDMGETNDFIIDLSNATELGHEFKVMRNTEPAGFFSVYYGGGGESPSSLSVESELTKFEATTTREISLAAGYNSNFTVTGGTLILEGENATFINPVNGNAIIGTYGTSSDAKLTVQSAGGSNAIFIGRDSLSNEVVTLTENGYLSVFRNVNDANPYYYLGSTSANMGYFRSVFDSGAKTYDYLEIGTVSDTEGDIVLNPAGNVGIATVIPSTLLTLGGNTYADDIAIRIHTDSTAGRTRKLEIVRDSGLGGEIKFDEDTRLSEGLVLNTTTSSYPIGFKINDVLKASLQTDGNFYINTTDYDGTPAVGKITVKATAAGNIFVGRNSSEVNTFVVDEDGSGYFADRVEINGTNSSFYLYVGGNTGIGVRSTGVDGTFTDILSSVYSGNPNEQNAIQSSVSANAANSGFNFMISNGGGSAVQTQAYRMVRSSHKFYINGAEKVTINSTGDTILAGNLTNNGYHLVGVNTWSKAVAAYNNKNILLDNGTSDTPGILFYSASNTNYGIDYLSGLRVVKNMDETGGVVKATFKDDELALAYNKIIIENSKTPSSASDTGTSGSICWDSSYVYICVATNTWKRAAIATW